MLKRELKRKLFTCHSRSHQDEDENEERKKKEKKTTSYIRERKSKFQIYLTPQQGFSRKGTNK